MWCLFLLTALHAAPSERLVPMLGDKHFPVRQAAYSALSYRHDWNTMQAERAGEHDKDPEIRHACRGLRWQDYLPPWGWEYVYVGLGDYGG